MNAVAFSEHSGNFNNQQIILWDQIHALEHLQVIKCAFK